MILVTHDLGHNISAILLVLGTLCAHTGCASPPPARPQERAPDPLPASFALDALSRGSGVPDPTRSAFEKVRNLLWKAKQDGKIIRLVQTRLGLEGETRIYAEFGDARVAQEMLQQIRSMVDGIELLNLVEEPCIKP